MKYPAHYEQDNVIFVDNTRGYCYNRCKKQLVKGAMCMKISDMGCNHKHDRFFLIDRPDGIMNWLLLVVKTPVVFEVNKKSYPFFENTFMLYPPGCPQYYYANNANYCNDWIEFHISDDEIQLMRDFNIPCNTPVPIPNVNVISNLTLNISNEFFSENPHKNLSIELYFKLLICKLSEMTMYSEELLNNPKATKIIAEPTKANTNSKYYTLLLHIRSEIYRWPGKNWHVADMARELAISPSYFQHLYSRTFGISVSKDIIKSRVNKAAELLRNTDWPVNHIGAYVGYRNTSYYIKQFKASWDMTPEQFRKANKS